MPEGFATSLDNQLSVNKDKGIKNWLDDIAIPSSAGKSQLLLLDEFLAIGQLREVAVLHAGGKVENVVMAVLWLGVWPAPSEIAILATLVQPGIVFRDKSPTAGEHVLAPVYEHLRRPQVVDN